MAGRTLHVLADNRAVNAALGFEHGWSVLVDLGRDGRWLWDTGQTGLFLENARDMGLDARAVDGVALSHGHHDHAGGLPALLEAGFRGPIVGHPDLLARRYSRRGGTTFRSIGMGDGRLPAPLPGFSPCGDARELAPGLTFLTGIPRRPGAFTATAHLYYDTAGQVPDPVPDDACLLVAGGRGPLLLLGCCHAGLGNTLAHVRQRLGIDTVEAVAGGLHLAGAPTQALEETLAALDAFGVRRLFPGHCTGQTALAWLDRNFSGQVTGSGSGFCLPL